MKLKYLALSLAIAVPSVGNATGILFDNAVAVDSIGATTLGNRVAGVAYDGTNYWAGLAGGAGGQTLAQYDASGNLITTHASGVDYRSIFTSGSNLYATDFGGGGIQVYNFSGATPSLMYSLSTTPDVQMELGLRTSTNSLYGHDNGTIYTYDFANGQQTGTFSLSGFSAAYPENVQLAVLDDYLLTYDDAGQVGVWDYAGNLLGQSLIGLTLFDQIFSFSYTDGLVWIEASRSAGLTGYDIGLSTPSAVPVPAALFMFAPALLGFMGLRRKAKATIA